MFDKQPTKPPIEEMAGREGAAVVSQPEVTPTVAEPMEATQREALAALEDKEARETEEGLAVNLNDKVGVQLTTEGEQVFNDYLLQYEILPLKEAGYDSEMLQYARDRRNVGGGVIELQLHGLMNIFGEAGVSCFEGNKIFLIASKDEGQGKPETQKALNLGTNVRVKLTDEGEKIYSAQGHAVKMEDVGIELPLHELMKIFGPACTTTKAPCFEDNMIFIQPSEEENK